MLLLKVLLLLFVQNDFKSASVLECWQRILPHLEPVMRFAHTSFHRGEPD